MPSGIGRTLEPRERRTLTAGTALVAVAALAVWVVFPFARHWSAREDAIDGARARLARLRSVAGHEVELAGQVRRQDEQLDAGGVRLLRARTPSLAASALQTLVQDYARASRVSVSRLDVAGLPEAGGALPFVPASVSATSDIYGISSFLRRLQHGPTLLEITLVAVAPNPTLRGNLLQLSVTMRAPILVEE